MSPALTMTTQTPQLSSMHNHWMEQAIREAKLAAAEDEIPVGAVIVHNEQIMFSDHNRTRQFHNPLAHAEKLIIDKIMAAKIKYLQEYTLYVTLEPCLMCAGMLIWSRLGKLVFGASDSKAGAAGSIYNVLADKSFNHHPQIVRGVREQECSALLKDYFRSKR